MGIYSTKPVKEISKDEFRLLIKGKKVNQEKEEMIDIEGIGERNFEKYGVYFLKVIRSSNLGQENGK